MTLNIQYSATPSANFVGYTPSNDFTYSVTQTPFGGTTTPIINNTLDINQNYTSSSTNNFSITVNESTTIPGHSFIALENITVNGSGQCTYVANGQAQVEINTGVGNRVYAQQMSMTATVTSFLNFKGIPNSNTYNSLAWHINNAIVTMVGSNTNSATYANLWSSNNYLNSSSLSAVRSTSCITNGVLDLSAISVVTGALSSSSNPWANPLVLISNHHAICAAHVAPTVGEVFTWLAPNGTTSYTVTVQTIEFIDSEAGPGTPDIAVCYFTPAIPNQTTAGGLSGINPMVTLPSTWANYIPCVNTSIAGTVYNPNVPPVISRGVYNKAHTATTDTLNINNWYYTVQNGVYLWQFQQAINADTVLASWGSDTFVSPASSTPFFIPVDHNNPSSGFSYQPVLLGMLTTNTGQAGCIPAYITQINSAMVTAALAQSPSDTNSYSIGTISLTNFPSGTGFI
jgi:hypothetical protein